MRRLYLILLMLFLLGCGGGSGESSSPSPNEKLLGTYKLTEFSIIYWYQPYTTPHDTISERSSVITSYSGTLEFSSVTMRESFWINGQETVTDNTYTVTWEGPYSGFIWIGPQKMVRPFTLTSSGYLAITLQGLSGPDHPPLYYLGDPDGSHSYREYDYWQKTS